MLSAMRMVLAAALLVVALGGCGPKKPPPLKPVPTHVDVPDKVPQTRTFWTPTDKPCPVFKSYFKCRKVTQGECVERRGTRNTCKS